MCLSVNDAGGTHTTHVHRLTSESLPISLLLLEGADLLIELGCCALQGLLPGLHCLQHLAVGWAPFSHQHCCPLQCQFTQPPCLIHHLHVFITVNKAAESEPLQALLLPCAQGGVAVVINAQIALGP